MTNGIMKKNPIMKTVVVFVDLGNTEKAMCSQRLATHLCHCGYVDTHPIGLLICLLLALSCLENHSC